MLFLKTADGLISHRAVVRIKAMCIDDGQTIHEVAYVHGTEALKTTAIDDDVQDYLDELQ